MATSNIYSKRQKAQDQQSDVYTYDIPRPLRIQIVHILRDFFGDREDYDSNGCLEAFQAISNILCREYGLFELSNETQVDDQVVQFLLKAADDQVLDVIEVSLNVPSYGRSNSYEWQRRVPDEKLHYLINELNARFREHGVGYQYEAGEIIRIDSQLIHAEVVKPVLVLISDNEYEGTNAEFLKAFEHYRKGNTKECLNECLKAFESTMKAICRKRSWAFNDKDTASALIDVCMRNNLVPALMQSHIGSVRSSLESGIPTLRNRMSGHGQGATVVNVPPHYASYMLHLTATTIKFLIESEKALP